MGMVSSSQEGPERKSSLCDRGGKEVKVKRVALRHAAFKISSLLPSLCFPVPHHVTPFFMSQVKSF